jgi:NAD(P)-dependent dehydrogenase (short-subunit alcohol dehydrogenase family)
MTQKAIPHLAKTKGNVVMTGATMAVRPSFLGQWYSVSKAALDQYVKVAACTYAPAGIRVNGVRAGAVMTNVSISGTS